MRIYYILIDKIQQLAKSNITVIHIFIRKKDIRSVEGLAVDSMKKI